MKIYTMNGDCLGTHLMECDLVEIEDIDNTGE